MGAPFKHLNWLDKAASVSHRPLVQTYFSNFPNVAPVFHFPGPPGLSNLSSSHPARLALMWSALKPLDYDCSSSGHPNIAVPGVSALGLPDHHVLQLQLVCQSCLAQIVCIGVTALQVTLSRLEEVAILPHS